MLIQRQQSIYEDPSELTEVICWSRMQSESGQDMSQILARKELERRANDGLFCWGVGNAPSTAVASLSRAGAAVDVVFSVMKSRPKAVDVSPSEVLAWRSYIDADGRMRTLPEGSLVTSRAHTASGAKRNHYALMCMSETPLSLGSHGSFDPSAYRNVGGAGAPIGNSQVTALLRRVSPERGGDYTVNLKARLAESYWVKLVSPVTLTAGQVQALANVGSQQLLRGWLELLSEVQHCPPALTYDGEDQLGLF